MKADKLMKNWNKGEMVNMNILGKQAIPSIKSIMGNIPTKPLKGGINQKQYLRRMKTKPVPDRMINYFTDSDKDGVVNALDCMPRNYYKHGIISWVKGKISRPEEPEQTTYAEKHEVRIAAGKQRVLEEKQKQERETHEEMEKRQRAMKEAAKAELQVQADEADEAKEQYYKYTKSPEFKPGSPEDRKVFNKLAKEMREEKQSKERYKQVSDWHGERKAKAIKEFELEISKSKAEIKREKIPSTPLHKRAVLNIADIVGTKIQRARWGVSRATGYVFEEPEQRRAFIERDITKQRKEAELAGVDPKYLQGLEERRKGYKEKIIARKTKGSKTVYDVAKQPLPSSEKLSGSEFSYLIDKRVFEKQKEKSKAKILEELEKKEFKMRALDARRKAEFSKLNIKRTKMEHSRLSGMGSFGGGILGRDPSFGGKSQVFGGTSWPYSESQSFYGETTPGYIPKPSTGVFKSEAPKFTYKKGVRSFTRKTSRVRAKDVLQIGKPSIPSFKKSKGRAYPWTKPMKGWTRVYEGTGRTVGRGRKKKTKAGIKSFYTQTKPKKMGFQPYATTYELKGITPKGKKISPFF